MPAPPPPPPFLPLYVPFPPWEVPQAAVGFVMLPEARMDWLTFASP